MTQETEHNGVVAVEAAETGSDAIQAQQLDVSAEEAILHIAQVSSAMGFQDGVPAQDIAGAIISFLAVHPEQVARFMVEGAELFIDGTIRPELGSLSYRAVNGSIMTPAMLRKKLGASQ